VSLADYQTLVDNLVRDDSGKIVTADRDEAIARAASRYSKDRPQTKVEDVVTTGDNTLPLPTAWEAGFSAIISLEYPVGDVPPSIIEPASYSLYDSPSGQVIMIKTAVGTGKTVRAAFTIAHVVGASDTTPEGDREAIAAWAAALLGGQLASIYSGDSDSTIQADSVDHGGKARDFAIRASSLRKRYFDELGIDPKRNVAAGVVVDLDMRDSRGNDRLTHPGRYR